MAEQGGGNQLPQATVVPGKRTRISVVWTIPILAAVVAIGIAIQRIMSEGPTITIEFKVAEGLEAGKSFVKYKDVNIGQVTAVQLSPDHTKVVVTAKIDKSASSLMVEDAKFWIVEPRITLSGISGLGTLLSGNYIGFEVGKSGKAERKFTGLDIPPIITGGQPGRQFVLNTKTLGSLGVGSPVYYRQLRAGQVIAYELASDGTAVRVKVFINAPFDKYVIPGTRFWNASGIDVSLGASGVDVRTESLVTVLAGGLAFDTPDFAPAAGPAAENTVFEIYRDRATAMKEPDPVSRHYVLYFNQSLRGLSVGAPVTLLGLAAGEVTDVGLTFDPSTMNIRGRVEIASYPERIIARLERKKSAAAETLARSARSRHEVIRRLVEQRGLRAQLRSGNLITGQLYVAFDYFPDAPKVKVDWNREVVELPVVPSTVEDVEAKIASIAAKLDKLPYETIGSDLTKVLASLDKTLKSVDQAVNRLDTDVTPGLKKTVQELGGAIATADRVLKNADATLVSRDAPAQQELRDALQALSNAARSIRVLADYLDRHPEALLRGKLEEGR